MASFDDHVARRVGELAQVVHANESLKRSLRRVADMATDVINRCDAASVSLSHEGRVSTWASTHAAAERADQHQYQTDEGPCLDAIRTGQANFVDSLKADQRWPAFTPLAVAEGMAALYSLPLKVGEDTVGALNLYSRSRSFAFPDLQAAEALAAQAAVTLANAESYHRAQERIRHLEDSLVARVASDEEEAPSAETER